jgi:hypothetical protein
MQPWGGFLRATSQTNLEWGVVVAVSPRLLFGQDGNNSLSALAGNTDMLLLMLWGSGNPGHMLLKFS